MQSERFRILIQMVIVGLIAGIFPTPVFSTPPNNDVITVAAFGDYGLSTEAEGAVAAMVHTWNPDFIVTTGDNNYYENTFQGPGWENVIGAYYGDYIQGRTDNLYPTHQSPTQRFFPSVGNHDVEGGGCLPDESPGEGASPRTGIYAGSIRGYLDYFHVDPGRPEGRLPAGTHTQEHSFYDFRQGPAHFFAIDSDRALCDAASLNVQQVWLQAALAASDAPWKFVYFHHPSYSTGPHGSHFGMQWPFKEWGADAVLTGHDHNYERFSIDGIPYFVTGLGGAGPYGFPRQVSDASLVRYADSNGAMRLTIDAERVLFEFLAIDPQLPGNALLIDSFELMHVVPEPATGWLLAFGVMVLAWRRRKE
jgi:tartrate-resistant acid phosphatase type 5